MIEFIETTLSQKNIGSLAQKARVYIMIFESILLYLTVFINLAKLHSQINSNYKESNWSIQMHNIFFKDI